MRPVWTKTCADSDAADHVELLDFFSKAERAQNPQSLRLALLETLHRLGISFFQLVRISHDGRAQHVWSHVPNSAIGNVELAPMADASQPVPLHSALGTAIVWPDAQIEYFRSQLHTLKDQWLAVALADGMETCATLTICVSDKRADHFRLGSRMRNLAWHDAGLLHFCCTVAAFAAHQLRSLEARPNNCGNLHPALSSRELEVVSLCRDGKSYPEIARILGVSTKTIEFHMTNVMRKLGVNQKISVILEAARFGLIRL